MKQRNVFAAAVLLAVLSGVVWWAQRHPQSTGTSTSNVNTPKLASIPDAQIQQITVTKKDSPPVVLAHQSGKWSLTAPQNLAADQDAAKSMASSLDPVTADNVVEDKPTDLSKYGLAAPSLVVAVQQTNGKSQDLYFGDDVPAGSLVYARVGNDPKVYAVSSSVKTAFDKTANDLRDKRLLTFDPSKVTRVEVDSSKGDIEFGKNNQNDWQIIKPQPYRAEGFQVEELLRRLGDAKMDLSGNAEDAKKAASNFVTGQHVATAKVTDASGTQDLDVRKKGDDFFAKSSVVAGVYKIPSDLGKEFEKSVDDYRTKKIFDFGFSDLSKLEVQQGTADKVYVRSGSDWKLNGQTMDPGSVQALIDKLRDLSATKFVDAGFTSPALTITATSNDGKRVERVEFAKTGDGYIARRGNEAGLYQLDGKTVNDILEASNAIKPTASSAKK
jgi:hypothetical protein